jgi:hypothetical protein
MCACLQSVVQKGRYFVREGNISKVCSNGDRKKYRMFLFSDALLYAEPVRSR